MPGQPAAPRPGGLDDRDLLLSAAAAGGAGGDTVPSDDFVVFVVVCVVGNGGVPVRKPIPILSCNANHVAPMTDCVAPSPIPLSRKYEESPTKSNVMSPAVGDELWGGVSLALRAARKD